MNKTLKIAIAAVFATVTGAALAQAPAGQMSGADVMQRVEQAGYTDIRDVEFDDGFWEVEATSADGSKVELYVDPRSGEVLDRNAAPTLTAADIAARLEAAGYTNVRDVEFDDGRYEAEATNAAGQNVDLKVDGRDGSVVHEDIDD
jgi:hypothetical protein